jgi:HSP20 family protein
MTNLMLRDNLFSDLFEFRRDFDDIFNRMLNFRPMKTEHWAFPEVPVNFVPEVESFVDKDAKKYFCRVSLPGIDPKDIEVHNQGNLLTIKGEKKINKTMKEADVQHSEFYYGKFNRMLTLPEGVVFDKLAAEFVNGVLEITAPVATAALPRKVEVKPIAIAKAA